MGQQVKDTQYAYAVAKVRAVEGGLLDKAKLARLADAGGLEEVVKLLREAGYPAAEGGWEAMLSGRMAEAYAFLRDISPVAETFDIFLVQNDYHNVKVLLKAEFLGENRDGLLKSTGRFEPARLKAAVADRVLGGFPETLRRAVSGAIDVYDRTGDPQESDMLLDAAAFQEMSLLAEQSGSGFVASLVAVLADLTNIRTFGRVKMMGRGYDFLRRALVPGGTIAEMRFLSDTGAQLADIVAGTPYADLDTSGIAALERSADEYLARYARNARFVTFGIEPLVAYLLAVQSEVRQVRIVLTGKANGLAPEVIKERLRETYV